MQSPLPFAAAWFDVARCVGVSAGLLARREVHQPRRNLGRVLSFADGTAAQVYRETVLGRRAAEPCVLVVSFRLRGVRGRGHRLFRGESLLNTPLFVGYPGFVSKLWLAHDQRGRYRGIYQWDGSGRAERYARSLWRVLALVSEPGTIAYQVLPGLDRDAVVDDPSLLEDVVSVERDPWWRPVAS